MPNANRILRSPAPTSSNVLPNRGFRRSLDASMSLPSFSDVDSPQMHSIWNIAANARLNVASRGTSPEGSGGKGTPKQRVSFDSDRGSLPNVQSVRQSFSRMNRGSDPAIASPTRRSQKEPDSPTPTSRSPSRSRSRAASPLRLFQQWSAGRRQRHADEPFVPVDPFKAKKTHFNFPCLPTTAPLTLSHTHNHTHDGPGSPGTAGCDACIPRSSSMDSWSIFITDTLPRQLYLNLLLFLPAMYFSRVAKIFEDAEVSRPDIQRMIESGGGSAFLPPSVSEQVTVGTRDSTNQYPPGTRSPTTATAAGIALVGVTAGAALVPLPLPDEWSPPLVSPALIRFKQSWEVFIDSLLREWKTLNVVSALLLSYVTLTPNAPNASSTYCTECGRGPCDSNGCAAVAGVRANEFVLWMHVYCQIRDDAKHVPGLEVGRGMPIALYGSEYVFTEQILFCRKRAKRTRSSGGTSGSMILFIASILCFVWRTGAVNDPEDGNYPPLSTIAALGPRIAITFTFALGLVYLALIIKTLRSYGTHTSSTAWGRKAHPESEQTPRMRSREVDAAMESRGRPRQRSASGPRRREAAPEEARHSSLEGLKDGHSHGGGLRSLLGLGIVGVVPRDQTHLDLEKGLGGEKA
ncbi:hypothetical protein H0H81_000763 [Sphagnurus paluster]|uniref:Uncharacterized protein n=1 Tax=Sphagnurus paluster TaxID=117069 RepID=A0A9P7KHS3_9AGAR|nr:hypothetical protein H0H81_000763 [Sphagnurus paluster]